MLIPDLLTRSVMSSMEFEQALLGALVVAEVVENDNEHVSGLSLYKNI